MKQKAEILNTDFSYGCQSEHALARAQRRKTLISQLLDKISKFCFVTFLARVQAVFVPNFCPLALKMEGTF